MAIEDEYDFTGPRTGPKTFTEYSFNAILVLVGLIGSFLTVLGGASLYIFLLPFSMVFGNLTAISAIFGLAMIPFGIVQMYHAWKIHSENFTDFRRVIITSWILIILSITSAIFMGILIILTLQLVIGQIFVNILVVFFLGKDEVQQEFIWESGGN